MTLSYYSHFDKIYQGETFKTILTVMNTSGNQKVNQLKLRVSISKQGQTARPSGEIKLLDERIEELAPGACVAFPLNFQVENTEAFTYMMTVDMHYSSPRFIEQLN